MARARGIRGLRTWKPNEAAVQRYRPGPYGITSHLDGKRYRRLVTVVTTTGEARFSLHSDRDAPPKKTWMVGPGGRVLLRAPGLAGAREGRPVHANGAPG